MEKIISNQCNWSAFFMNKYRDEIENSDRVFFFAENCYPTKKFDELTDMVICYDDIDFCRMYEREDDYYSTFDLETCGRYDYRNLIKEKFEYLRTDDNLFVRKTDWERYLWKSSSCTSAIHHYFMMIIQTLFFRNPEYYKMLIQSENKFETFCNIMKVYVFEGKKKGYCVPTKFINLYNMLYSDFYDTFDEFINIVFTYAQQEHMRTLRKVVSFRIGEEFREKLFDDVFHQFFESSNESRHSIYTKWKESLFRNSIVEDFGSDIYEFMATRIHNHFIEEYDKSSQFFDRIMNNTRFEKESSVPYNIMEKMKNSKRIDPRKFIREYIEFACHSVIGVENDIKFKKDNSITKFYKNLLDDEVRSLNYSD